MQKPSWWVLWGLLLTGCFFSLAAQAQVEVEGQSYTSVQNLKEEMLVYSESYDTYVPYVKGTPFNASAAVIVLNLRKYSDYQLYVQPPAEAALLINQRIVDYYWNGATALYPIDSLRALYGDSCVVSIFHPTLSPESLEVAVIGRYPYSYADTEKELDEYLKIFERPGQSFTNFFIVGVLALLALLAVLRNLYPKVFASYYDLSRAAAIRVRDEANFTMKLSGRGHLPFLIFHSILFGFLLMVLLQQLGEAGAAFSFLEVSTFGGYLYAWLLLAGIVFFFQLLNYWLLQIVALIFNIPEFANVHFFDFLRLSHIFYTILFVLVTLLFLGAGAYIETGVVILLRVVVVFILLRVLLIFFKLLHLSSFRKTYLFSYLCTTEILPLLIVLKFLII
jgi:hypothetical protein